jgi:serine protease Do
MDTTVTIGDRDKVFADSNNAQPQTNQEGESDAGEAKLGVVVRDAPPAITAKIHTSGVLVESVRTGSFADLQGVEPGLVIPRVNKQSTGTKEQFDAVVGKLKTGDDVVFEAIDPHHPEQGIDIIGGTL